MNWGDGSPQQNLTLSSDATSFSLSHTYLDDNPSGTASDLANIMVSAVNDGGTANASANVTVNNVAPVISSVAGPLGPLTMGSTASITTNFTDVGTQDTHTCTFSWDDGQPATAGTVAETAGSGSCTGTRTFTASGVYAITVTVTDDDTGSATSIFQFVVVYDPNAGFVTGGGWINSPAGAYTPNSSLVGRANFGFVSKYQKGANVPTGQTEFEFSLGNLKFHSTVYQWLVVAGAKASIKALARSTDLATMDFC